MKATLSRNTTVVAVSDQVSCTLEDEAVVLHLGKGTYYGLNPVGATVWNALQQPKTVGELVEIVTGEFEVEAGRCEGDLLELLANLQNAGLIEVRSEPAA
ncbi:MAG: PqqD family protein [Acidobacteria bacterium]|nr:PqqD family protein [Acidobacteriota bacterium]